MPKVVMKTKWDDAEGRIGWKKLLLLVSIIIVLGAGIILVSQEYIVNNTKVEAVITTVNDNDLVGFMLLSDYNELMEDNHTQEETATTEHGHEEFGINKTGNQLEEGQHVLIMPDKDEGNLILEILD